MTDEELWDEQNQTIVEYNKTFKKLIAMKKNYVYLIKTLTKEQGDSTFEYGAYVQAFTSLKKAQTRMNEAYEINKGFGFVAEYNRLDYSVHKKDMDGNFTPDVFDIRHIIEKIEIR